MLERFRKAEKEKVYLTDGFEFGRTVPVKDAEGHPYTGFVKTTIGEHKVLGTNEVIHELLMAGREITEDEYLKTKLTVINDIAI